MIRNRPPKIVQSSQILFGSCSRKRINRKITLVSIAKQYTQATGLTYRAKRFLALNKTVEYTLVSESCHFYCLFDVINKPMPYKVTFSIFVVVSAQRLFCENFTLVLS
jgi:hypothetical protein